MPIQILPARLANQIAAGEVVERPASVVKELVENSLDSGATKIELDIEKGGHKRICVRDNGKGINKDELTLALSRHATSKISSLDDLESITSMGFRGEALASISSVSRLALISKPANQSEAWQAQCEGREMQVKITPAAHPDGTSVDVQDLFFNTPARRKFLRTEKTEFSHIDEIMRRIALSRFDVSFTIRHNGKVVRKYPAASNDNAQLKRIGSICGNDFAQQAMLIESEYQGLKLSGWLATHSRPHGDLQYFYVNGRMMRDKLINHAIRQAYEGLLEPEQYPAYVLYLQIEPDQVDVNVHPAKHEVRFHQARLVHDFLLQVLKDALQQTHESGPDLGANPISHEPLHDYIKPLAQHQSSPTSGSGRESSASYGSSTVSRSAAENYQQLMSPASPSVSQPQAQDFNPSRWLQISNQQLLIKLEQDFWLLDTLHLYQRQVQQLLTASPVPQPLLMPVAIEADENLLQAAQQRTAILSENGIEIGCSPKRIMLRKVPSGTRELNWSLLLPALLDCEYQQQSELHQAIINTLPELNIEFGHHQTTQLWQRFVQECAEDWKQKVQQWAKPVPLQQWLQQL